tara:strand:- start:13215 stop:14378 length:1164 start_codon:yes stop_codon:yes gene_type:complete
MSLNNDNEFVNWEDITNLDQNLLRGIYSYGFENPSIIQQKSIIPFLNGSDIIAQAQSGTGKTGSFSIGTINRINVEEKTSQALIISPTRELSLQTKKVVDSLSCMIKNLSTYLLVGGSPLNEDISFLNHHNPHIIIGCPGRIHDMLRRKVLNSKHFKIIVLDEADEMLSTGFKEQIYNIFEYMPFNIQATLFSATIPDSIHNIINKFMRDPIKILVKTEQLTLEGIDQYYVALDNDSQKYEALKDLYDVLSLTQCIIYCNSVKRVEDLYNAMTNDNFPVSHIHSNMSKDERLQNYENFRVGQMRVLISSNVTARGIDIQQVSTVINFDIPKCVHTYLHRIGRSGRWGRKGMGINFITKKDVNIMRNIEKYYATEIRELPNEAVNKIN